MRSTSILSLSLLYSRFFFVQSNNSFTEIRIIMFVVREYQIVRFNQWETRVGYNWPITDLETHPNWCVLPTQISYIFKVKESMSQRYSGNIIFKLNIPVLFTEWQCNVCSLIMTVTLHEWSVDRQYFEK